jgi:hypothetical protein
MTFLLKVQFPCTIIVKDGWISMPLGETSESQSKAVARGALRFPTSKKRADKQTSNKQRKGGMCTFYKDSILKYW